MKLIVPFDTSVSPPKRFWSALWKPVVPPENPEADFEIMRRSMVPGASDVLLDADERGRVTSARLCGASARVKRAFEAVGEWFRRREAAEREEQSAGSRGLDALATARSRDALRTRNLRM